MARCPKGFKWSNVSFARVDVDVIADHIRSELGHGDAVLPDPIHVLQPSRPQPCQKDQKAPSFSRLSSFSLTAYAPILPPFLANSLCSNPAICCKNLAGDVTRGIRCQENGQSPDFSGLSEPAHGDGVLNRLLKPLTLLQT